MNFNNFFWRIDLSNWFFNQILFNLNWFETLINFNILLLLFYIETLSMGNSHYRKLFFPGDLVETKYKSLHEINVTDLDRNEVSLA